MSTIQQSPDSDPRPARSDVTGRRVLLTIAIIGGALLFMVLPWIFLFHAPEQFAGWAASGVVLAIAVHLFLNSRKRRKALDEMLNGDDDPTTPAP